MDKEFKKEFDNLGRMVKAGFDGVDKRFEQVDKRFDKIEEQIAALKTEVLLIKSDIEDLKLRMAETAFRFELRDLEKRLEKVEMKLNL